MSNVWLTAWAISLVPLLITYRYARRAGLTLAERVLMASVFFPSPLMAPGGNRAAFVYLFDATVPLALWICFKRWKQIPSRLRWAAVLLMGALGVLPLAVAATGGTSQDALIGFVNAYRIMGAMALMCAAATFTGNRNGDDTYLLAPISAFAILLLGAMAAQATGIVQSNLFDAIDAAESMADGNPALDKFDVIGLFRGSIGAFAVLGIVVFLAAGLRRGLVQSRRLPVFGGAAAFAAMLLVGSKTAIVVSAFAGATYTLFSSRETVSRFPTRMAGFALIVVAAALAARFAGDSAAVSQLRGIVRSEEGALRSFDERQERWKESADIIDRNPYTIIGIASSEARLNVAYYHNEYLGLLMTGGVWSVSAYLLALGLLAQAILRGQRTPARTVGMLALVGGVVQGLTVVHLYPGVFFTVPVAMASLYYGLASRRGPRSGDWSGDATLHVPT